MSRRALTVVLASAAILGAALAHDTSTSSGDVSEDESTDATLSTYSSASTPGVTPNLTAAEILAADDVLTSCADGVVDVHLHLVPWLNSSEVRRRRCRLNTSHVMLTPC